MDAIPFLGIMGYLLGNLEIPGSDGSRGGVERFATVAALVAGPMFLAQMVASTPVAIGATGLGALLGYNVPFWAPPRKSGRR